MPELDRVWRIAWLHGYRVGLQMGRESPVIVLHVRDLFNQRPVIAIIAPTIDAAAEKLLDRMILDEYVPRSDEAIA